MVLYRFGLAICSKLRIDPVAMILSISVSSNLTPIGASANITAVGLLESNGYKVSFGDFLRIGVPYTLVAVLAGYIYLWIVWA